MIANMGKIDRLVRIAVAAALLVFAFSAGTAAMGALQWIAVAIAAVFALTAVVGNCPAYRLIGVKTCRLDS
jgi:hypothetical protein